MPCCTRKMRVKCQARPRLQLESLCYSLSAVLCARPTMSIGHDRGLRTSYVRNKCPGLCTTRLRLPISLMHPCLAIPEIVLKIVEDINCEEVKQHQQTLAALARTCTAFHEAALDKLWSQQIGIANLMRCLPPHKLRMKEKKLVHTIVITIAKFT